MFNEDIIRGGGNKTKRINGRYLHGVSENKNICMQKYSGEIMKQEKLMVLT